MLGCVAYNSRAADPESSAAARDPPKGGPMSTESVLSHHLAAVSAGDVDGILSDYSDDAVLLTPDATLRGPAEIRPLFDGFVNDMLPPGSDLELKRQEIVGEQAYILWRAASATFDFPLGTDTFIVRGDKIVFQTFAAQIEPKG